MRLSRIFPNIAEAVIAEIINEEGKERKSDAANGTAS